VVAHTGQSQHTGKGNERREMKVLTQAFCMFTKTVFYVVMETSKDSDQHSGDPTLGLTPHGSRKA
jgi:hypothetical protein